MHLVFSVNGWKACEPCTSADDIIVLMGDGVYATPKQQVYAIADDLQVRGMFNNTNPSMISISYDDFVSLTESHHPSISWND